MFDKITKQERDMIFDAINAYASKVEGNSITPCVSFEQLFARWAEAKKSSGLYKMFDNALYVEYPIMVNCSVEELTNEAYKIRLDRHIFYRRIWDWLEAIVIEGLHKPWSTHEWETAPGEKYALTPAVEEIWLNIKNMLYMDTLCKNRYDGPDISFCIGETKIQFVSGMKPCKALKKMAIALGMETDFEAFRLLHSQVLNQKTIKGKMCLSIHPLDYITMSDNNYNWKSCMSWQNHGEYRQGTVEMMNSPNVVVAYLLPEKEEHNFYNKKWRQLFIVDPYIIMGIKQYPYKNDELEGFALNKLRELAIGAGIGHYTNNIAKIRNYQSTHIAEADLYDITFVFTTEYMYNDIEECGNYHFAYVSTDIKHKRGMKHYIKYSGEPQCMICGGPINAYDDIEGITSWLTCNECEPVVYCDNCHQWELSTNNMHWIESEDIWVCDYCWENDYHTCQFCGEIHHYDSFYKIHIKHKGKQYHHTIYFDVCRECWEENRINEIIGPVVKETIKDSWYNTQAYFIDTKYVNPDIYDKLQFSYHYFYENEKEEMLASFKEAFENK